MNHWRSSVVGLAVVVHAVAFAAERPAGVRLVEVTSESTVASQSVLITASEPASYTTFQPDPLTVMVILRGVVAGEVVARLRPAPDAPVTSVDVVEAVDDDGTPVAQVRIGLSEPTVYEVRSRRETTQVRFARPVASRSARAPEDTPVVPSLVGEARPATALLSVGTAVEPHAIVVTLNGNGVLSPGRIHETEHLPPRLVLEFPHLTAEAASLTPLEVDPVTQVRVSSDGSELTRVVLDLARPAVYHIEHLGENGRTLRLVFPRDRAIDPVAQIGLDPAAETAGEWRTHTEPTNLVAAGLAVRPMSGVGATHGEGTTEAAAPRRAEADTAPQGEIAPERRGLPEARSVPSSLPRTAVVTPVDTPPLAAVTEVTGPAAAGVDGRSLMDRVPADTPSPVWEARDIARVDGPVSFAIATAPLPRPVAGDVPPRVWPEVRQSPGAVVTLGPGAARLLVPVAGDIPPRVWPEIRQLPGAVAALAPDTALLLFPTRSDVPAPPEIPWLSATSVALDMASASSRSAEPLVLSTLLPAAAPSPTTTSVAVAAEVSTALTTAAVAGAGEPALAVAPLPVVTSGPSALDETPQTAEFPIAASRQTESFVPLRGSGRNLRTAPVRGGIGLAGQQSAGAGQEYTGDPISLYFQGSDLRAVLRVFASDEVSGLNIVIDPSVQGEVNVDLTDVPWDQAFDIILRTNGLAYEVDGTVVRIASVQRLQQEAEADALLLQREAEAGVLLLETFPLSYARAEDLTLLLTNTVLSARGQVFTDTRTNTLIIRDLEARLTAARDLLGTLDRAQPQVEIEARIVEASHDTARALGIQWGVTGRVAQEIGNTLPFSFPNRGGITGRAGVPDGQGPSGLDSRALPDENAATVVNLAANAATSAIGLTLGAVNGALNLDIALSALESRGEARVLSSPHIVTQNNVQAEIVQGTQIPYQTVANNTVTTQFVDAALILRVTPQITIENTVIMQVEVTNDFPDGARPADGGPPAIKTQRATTTVQVADGETTVIGGIFKNTEREINQNTPFLDKIPFLGWMFRSSTTSENTEELLIFLSPRIVP